MSIVTRTGDDGTTALMYGRRVPKNDARVEAYGSLDELNSALGMAKALTAEEWLRERLVSAQKELVVVMGELSVSKADRNRYVRDGFELVTPMMTARLEGVVREVESQGVSFKGWATPGATPTAGALDVARTVCRRAERRVYDLRTAGELENDEVLIYLNRLSDLLWLLARWAETRVNRAT